MNSTHVWQELLQILTEEVGSRVVETWFKVLSFSQWDKTTNTVSISAPNVFIRDWVESQYATLLKTHLSRLLNGPVKLIILDENIGSNKGPKVRVPVVKVPVEQTATQPARYPTHTRYGFDSFVSGDTNAVALAAAQAVVQKPGILYNPFFVYGGSGLGKTHLLQAIGNGIKKNSPQARVVYQTADRFIHEFVNAVRFGKMQSFETRYKEADVLLVDDIQLLSHKEQTQEAFFHIFNALYEKGKQIVFSADVLPDDIEGLSDRLKSRLNGSLITDIKPPSISTKIAILQQKALQQDAPLQEDVARYIASRGSSNIRELEGLLIRFLAFATITHQAIDLDLAHRVLTRTGIEAHQQAPLDLPRIAQVVVKEFHTTIADLRSTKRQKNLIDARHVAMYVMKECTESSLRDIATYWFRKDHSTVSHAISKIEELRKTDLVLNEKICSIKRVLSQR